MAVTISDKDLKWLKDKISQLSRDVHELKTKEQSSKETWVTADDILSITGKDSEWLRKARERQYLTVKQISPKSYLYLLESLPEEFKMKQAG